MRVIITARSSLALQFEKILNRLVAILAIPEESGLESVQFLDEIRNASGSRPTADVRLAMQKAMQSDAAVFRTQETLDEGVEKVKEIYKTYADVGIKDRGMIWNSYVSFVSYPVFTY